MSLQSLLEDNRTEWQEETQKNILNSLLCKSHQYKSFGKTEDRLVMVFGKSHAGKTTFILTLLGVVESQLDEVNYILRAGVPEGSSSTSTAMIYQKSDDDMFGVCERGINNVTDASIWKGDKEQFIKKIAKVREEVEAGKRTSDNIIYLYLPKRYFKESEWQHGEISILDVPGYETRNEKERYHTDAILNKYMSISVLNIIVRSINDINDLQYFMAPNRDDASKLTSSKYIIVTTRSYSAENVFKYFLTSKEKREDSFKEILENECQRQFARIFGNRIPKVFPIDIGQSFHVLIDSKIKDQEDRDYLIRYREEVFSKIYECIYSKQANSLVSWVQEVIEDEDFYANVDIVRIDKEIEQIEKKRKSEETNKDKLESSIDRLSFIKESLISEIKNLKTAENRCVPPNTKDIIDNKIKENLNSIFTDHYKWKVSGVERSVSAFFDLIYSETMSEITQLLEEYDGFLNDDDRAMIGHWIEDGGDDLRDKVEKSTNKHLILKALNPSNKEKIELGRQRLLEIVPNIVDKIYKLIIRKIKDKIYARENEKNTIGITIQGKKTDLRDKEKNIVSLKKSINKLENEKNLVNERVKKDKSILEEYRIIARKCFKAQKDKIICNINKNSSREEKLYYILLLGVISNDYKKIMME